jgi:hypothetical protein
VIDVDTVNDVDPPALTDWLAGLRDNEKSSTGTAWPVSASGPANAFVTSERDAVRIPLADGWNVMFIVQGAAGASIAACTQVSVSLKSAAFAPVIEIWEMVIGAVPALVRVTTAAGLAVPVVWEPKLTVDGLKKAPG